ncbi:DUF4919 domain-containing protein [Halpernia sp.]|uniref:DUF4919 domain-containing protein n=1 Tax=Halpernia sp. TaxID=2782209 RepID=UPI003A927AC8
MKNFYLLLFCFFSLAFKAQKDKINFEEIKTNVQDSTSKYFYERIVFRFQYDPTLLDSLEMKHLYYGKFYSKYKRDGFNFDKFDFVKNFRSRDSEENIKKADQLLYKDPTDLEVLAIVLQVFSKENSDNREFGLRAMQLRRLLETILKSGSGEDENSAFTVMSVSDEFVLAGFLKINLHTFKRASKMTKDATFDRWKDGKKMLIFRIMKDESLAKD